MRRWKPLLAVAAILLILISIYSSIAYFTDKEQADNVFTVGTVDVTLDEPKWNSKGEHNITPGAFYQKDPTVHNVGDTDAYVRIHVRVTDYAAFMAAKPDFDHEDLFMDIGSKWIRVDEPKIDTAADTIEYIYTYNEILPAGKDTEPLFSGVTMPSFADAEFTVATGGSFDVTVYADAIQADGFSDHTQAFAAFSDQVGQ